MRRWALIFLLGLCAVGYFSYYWYLNLSHSSTPEIAIQKYIMKNNNPLIWSYDITVKPTNINDNHYGRQFVVDGYRYHETGEQIRFFYLKKNEQRGWYVFSAGTGP